jgi:signal transduction histidine kinase
MMIVYQDRVAFWPGVFLIIGQHILFAWLHNSGVRVLFFPEARVSVLKLTFHFGIALVQTAVASTWAGLLARQTLRNLRAEEERRELQEKLAVSDRLASLGLLAAGVGHEVNNPLAVILSTLQLIAEEVPEAGGSPLVRESLEDAGIAAQRIRTIVRDLQMLSRSDAASEVDLKAVVSGIVRACASETRPRARVTCELDDLPRVHGDEGRLGQVFLNLIVNAAQAIPEGRADSNVISITGRATVARTVQVEVRDSGQGIPAAELPRVFEPLFTTKPIGKGTGLGMSICHRIVTDLGGRIEIESVKGQGTCVRLELPAAPPRKSSAA